MDEEYIPINQVDSFESITRIPVFSYFIIIDDQGKYLFSSSFEFESSDSCETFFSKFKTEDKESIFRLKTVSEIITRLLTRRLLINQQKERNFIDLSEKPFYISLLHYHKLNFVAIYSEIENQFTDNIKDFIRGSLQGIASTFIALHSTLDQEYQNITPESENEFLQAIPVILYQQDLNSRNCGFCSNEKICLPKVLEKKIHQTHLD